MDFGLGFGSLLKTKNSTCLHNTKTFLRSVEQYYCVITICFDALYFITSMASSSTRKQCETDDHCKQIGVAQCEGCQRMFCSPHFSHHRQQLSEEIDLIIIEHDQLKNKLTEKVNNLQSHQLLKKINDWEKESIEIIQKKAEELRHNLIQLETTRSDELSQKLQSFSEQLNKCRDQSDYIETDLQRWRKYLEDLHSNLASSTAIDINRHENIPIVSQPYIDVKITNDSFERVFENSVQIQEDEKVVVYEGSGGYKEIRGKTKYNFGCHQIQLLIEHSSKLWTFLGINSESTALQSTSYKSTSAYGWCSSNFIYTNGHTKLNMSIFPNSRIEMKNNDVITLTLDCDNHKISMTNSRTKTTHDLTVDIHNCRLPWQLHVILRDPKSRVRILSV
jgi:hypothetical protein